MKTISMILGLCIFSTTAFADCRQVYKESRWGHRTDRVEKEYRHDNYHHCHDRRHYHHHHTTTTTVSSSGEEVAIVVGVIALAVGTVAIVKGIKKRRMINLIDDSKDYVASHGMTAPGRRLIRMFDKTNNGTFTLLDLAQTIAASNEDGSLCGPYDLPNFRETRESIKNGELKVITL